MSGGKQGHLNGRVTSGVVTTCKQPDHLASSTYSCLCKSFMPYINGKVMGHIVKNTTAQ